MYRIIGGDAREYGPVDEAIIRTWIAEGRINADTRARAEGMTEWRRLADFPEFADPFAPPATPPPPAEPVIPPIPAGYGQSSASAEPDAGSGGETGGPGGGASAGGSGSYTGGGGSYGLGGAGWSTPGGSDSYGANASAPASIAAGVNTRGPSLDIGSCFERAFDVLKAQPAVIIGATVVVLLIMFAVSLLLNRWVSTFVAMVVNGPLIGGLMALYLKVMRGQAVTAADVFSGFGPRALPLILAHVVMSVLIGVGLLLCIVPGVYLGIVWSFTFPLVMDRGLDFWPAMETSRLVIGPRFFPMLVLMLLCLVLSLAGVLACGIGTFVTTPVAIMAMLFAYEDLFGRSRA